MLDLSFNSISDITPLVSLGSLRWLRLEGNPVATNQEALRPLGVLPSLTDVDVTIPSLIPDANLRAAVRTALGLAADAVLTVANLESLTTLDAPGRQISNLSGLEQATGLTELHLNNNSISDIGLLTGLSALTHLDLRNNQITDVTPLIGLVNLEVLKLAGNEIADTSLPVDFTAEVDIDVVRYVAFPDAQLAKAVRRYHGVSTRCTYHRNCAGNVAVLRMAGL